MRFRTLLRRPKSLFRRPRPRPPGEPPRLAIVTCIKNEGEDLVEWLCFHRHVGVSEFIIYDNLSTDATRRVLASVPFRDEIRVREFSREPPQLEAFADAFRRYGYVLDWVAFLDADEYIVPLGETSLPEKLREWEAAGIDGIGIHWRMFGSSGHETRPDGLLTESFTHRAPDDEPANAHVKSLARIAKVYRVVTPHYFLLNGVYRLDDGTQPPHDFRGVAARASFHQGLAIHHYVTKSRAQCMKKIARGRPLFRDGQQRFRDSNYFAAHDRNEVEDDRAARVIAPIRDSVLNLRDEIGRDCGPASRFREQAVGTANAVGLCPFRRNCPPERGEGPSGG